MICSWFRGNELTFAISFSYAFGIAGDLVNAFIVPRLYDSSGLGPALMSGFIFCILSLATVGA